MQRTCRNCKMPFDPSAGSETSADAGPTAAVCPACRAAAEQQTDLIHGELGGEEPLPSEQETLPADPEATLTPSTRPQVSETGGGELKALGPYRIVRVLGRGGMGLVYEATDTRLDRRVALKVVKSGEVASPEELKRFRAEAQSAAKLKHPNIVPIYDVGRSGEVDYFVMEYVEGTTLDGWLRLPGRSYRERVEVIEKTARALHHAHEHGIIHRDIKPGNIMVDAGGEPHVMDFGLARNVESQSGMTVSGQAMGTPSYMPPEQAAGRIGDISPQSDVWSLGAVLYEALVGRPPFAGENVLLIMHALTYEDPPTPRAVDRKLPRDLETIALKCLEKDTGRRYASALKLADDIRRYLDGEPIAARPASIVYRMRKRLARHRALAVVSALFACALGALGVWSYLRIVRERDQARGALAQFVAERDAREKAEARQKDIEDRLARDGARDWQAVFTDDFSDPDGVADRWRFVTDNFGQELTWEVRDGRLHVWGGQPQAILLRQPVLGDVRLEFTCRQETDVLNDVSCFLSGTPSAYAGKPMLGHVALSGYMFGFGSYMNTRTWLTRSGETIYRKDAGPLRTGVTYRAIAEKAEGRLSYSIDGRTIIDVTDPEPLAGSHRYGIGLYGWVAHVSYDDVRISVRGTPTTIDMLTLADEYHSAGRFEAAALIAQDVEASTADPHRRLRAREVAARAREGSVLLEKLPGYVAELDATWPGSGRGLSVQEGELWLTIRGRRIEDLTPVRKIPIRQLDCSENEISSLAPLRDMQLTVLKCAGNPITDLSPLGALPLKELDCGFTQVADLGPLVGLQLNNLNVTGCPLTTLSPLAGMALEHLDCSMTGVNDLSPLAGSPLRFLNINGTGVSDLRSLQNMPLNELDITETRVRSLAALRGLPIVDLTINTNDLTSLEPIRDLALNRLLMGGNRIASLDALRGMPITELDISGNPVSDLSPLVDMPLRFLNMHQCRVESLEKLAGMSLHSLGCSHNSITDLAPLASRPLYSLQCDSNQIATIEPLLDDPPPNFMFSSELIPTAELERAQALWDATPRFARNARYVRLLIALRSKNVDDLMDMATEHRGNHYLSIPMLVERHRAHQVATGVGAHLVTIRDQAEHTLVTGLHGSRWIWTGLYPSAEGPKWVTGEDTSFASSMLLTPAGSVPLAAYALADRWYAGQARPLAPICYFTIEWEGDDPPTAPDVGR